MGEFVFIGWFTRLVNCIRSERAEVGHRKVENEAQKRLLERNRGDGDRSA